MGLNVSHIQLTLTPDKNDDFFYVDNWDIDCNMPLENYSKYVTTIDDFDYNKIIAIVKTEKQFEFLKNKEWFNANEFLNVFIGVFNDKMQEQIAKFIVSQKLDNLKTFESLSEIEGIEFHNIVFGEPIKVQGVYYIDDIGYQRKGMNSKFYDKFKKHMLWGKKEDFELAYTCVGGKWYLKHLGEEAVSNMKKNFKENFIDKYEFGKSLLCISF